METVKLNETDAAKTPYQPNSEVLPLIETVRSENQRLHIKLGNFASEKESLKQELVEVRSQFETERADRKKIGAKLSELKKNSSPTATLSEKLKPDAATIFSQVARQAQKIYCNAGVMLRKF
jgi:predicted  nucleic acid-binding Zn-ribbon protein